MTTPYEGQPATVQNNLPAAINIVSTSNTTPIVVTVAAVPAYWQTGDVCYVSGATDTSANGVWLTGTLTGTTIQLLTFPGGANSTPGGGGGAVGTITNLGFGATLPIPTDSDKPSGALWGVPYQALADRTAWLMLGRGGQMAQVFTSSGTWTKPSGLTASSVVDVVLIGGGGGGGSGSKGPPASGTGQSGGGGGGGGSMTRRTFPASDLASTITVTVGAVAAGGAAITTDNTDGHDGAVGNITSFGTLLQAGGGPLGQGGKRGSATTGGTADNRGDFPGGAGTGCTNGGVGATAGTTTGAGGAGAGGGLDSNGGTYQAGGDGGLCAGLFASAAAHGNPGAAGTSSTTHGPGAGGAGGNAAAGGLGAGGNGGNGGNYGGGGGGGGCSINGAAQNSGKGGDGAAGLCLVFVRP